MNIIHLSYGDAGRDCVKVSPSELYLKGFQKGAGKLPAQLRRSPR